jgi:hypothetical protein
MIYALSTTKWKFAGTGSMVEYPFALDVHPAFRMKRTICDGRSATRIKCLLVEIW